MKAILLSLAAALVFVSVASAQSAVCDKQVAVDISATGPTQIIASPNVGDATHPSATGIHLCGVQLTAASAVAISLVSGTGTNCGTGTATVAKFLNSTLVSLLLGPYMPVDVGANNAFCLTLGSGVNVTGIIKYRVN